MLDPVSLFIYEDHVDQRTVRANTLVVTLGSFMDAGHSQAIVDRHLLDSVSGHQLGHFDMDQVLDYAGHRPVVTFDRDHLKDYEPPQITLHQLTDAAGNDFLLLQGPEPSLQWERMAASVAHLIEQFDVQQTVLLQGIPAPAPHTRPTVITQYASDPTLLEEEPVFGSFQMSATFGSALTVRLDEAGHDVRGLVAHVPHYLAEGDYAPAAIALLGELSKTASLDIPTSALEVAAAATLAGVTEQVEASDEVGEVVRQLEQNYDAFVEGRRRITAEAENLPSADEIGAEFEDFLKGLGGPDASAN